MTQNSNDTGLLIHINSLCDWFDWHLFDITLTSGKIRFYLAHTTLDLFLKKTPWAGGKVIPFCGASSRHFQKVPETKCKRTHDVFVRDFSLVKEVALKCRCNESLLMR